VNPEPDPLPTAVAIRADRIVFVGDDATALSQQTAATQLLDLAGAVVIPGFCDGHAHLYGLGKALAQADLVGTTSPTEVVARLEAFAATVPAESWVEGRGWDQNDWREKEFPHHALLDAVCPQQPVKLRRVDGHAAWVNKKAMQLARITASTPDPPGGRIVKDAAGEPTGILIDNAIDLIDAVIPEPSASQLRHRVDLAVAHCLQHGITGVHEAGVSARRASLYRQMAQAGELQLRLYGMLADDSETLDEWLPAGPFTSDDGMLAIRAVKLYADGALGSRGALLLADYADDPGNRGLLVTPNAHLLEVARRAGQAGFQVCTHAIGDAGNRLTLDLYDEVLGQLGLTDARWRVEHAQILHPDDLARFGNLNVIASMQPVHCTSDMDWVRARVGPEVEKGAYAWRSLLEAGAWLCFGTDFPVERVDPLAGLYAARTRTHQDGLPQGGWHPEQCLTGREALYYYTAGPAYAAFQEESLGAIKVGYLADLTVLSGDPVASSAQDLLNLQTWMTIVGGEIRFDGRP
jgi:predicted amidohydrolase YtcJ